MSTPHNPDYRQIAVVDDWPDVADERVNALSAHGLRAEAVTSVSRFRELAAEWREWLFLMDFAYENRSTDLRAYKNASGLLESTADLHGGKARVVLLSADISRPNRATVQVHAIVEDNLSADEWKQHRAAWCERLRIMAAVNPENPCARMAHLPIDGRRQFVGGLSRDSNGDQRPDGVLVPFARAWLAAESHSLEASDTLVQNGIWVALIQGWAINDPAGTVTTLTHCLETWTGARTEVQIVGEDELSVSLGPADMVGELSKLTGTGKHAPLVESNQSEGSAPPKTKAQSRRPIHVVVAPPLQRVVGAIDGPESPSESACAAAFENWLQSKPVKSLAPPLLMIVPLDEEQLPRAGICGASGLVRVIGLGHPSSSQVRDRLEHAIDLKRKLWLRTNDGAAKEALARVVNRCIDLRCGYRGVEHVREIWNEVGTIDDVEARLKRAFGEQRASRTLVMPGTEDADWPPNPVDWLEYADADDFLKVFPFLLGRKAPGGTYVILTNRTTSRQTCTRKAPITQRWIRKLQEAAGDESRKYKGAASLVVGKMRQRQIVAGVMKTKGLKDEDALMTAIAKRLRDLDQGPAIGNRNASRVVKGKASGTKK